jgi:hypothetical protein
MDKRRRESGENSSTMELYEWCKDCMAPPAPIRALVGDAKEEATLYLSKDSLVWKTNAMGGISLSAVKMVEAEDENTLSIGYSSGTRIESVKIELLDTEQPDWNKPLLKWYLHLIQGDVLTTSVMKVYEQYYLAFRREFEKMFDIAYNQNKSIREMEVNKVDSWHNPVHMLNQLLEKEYPILLKYHPKDPVLCYSPQRIHLVDFPKFPYQTQLNCAKLYYLRFIAAIASAKSSLLRSYHGTLYSDSEGMTPDDYEKLFLHYGLIEKSFLSEEFKATLMNDSNVDYLEDANGLRPKDYKQWFLRTPAPLVSK